MLTVSVDLRKQRPHRARRPHPPRDLRAPRRGPAARSASSPAGCPVSRPAVSQHLKVLKDAGLVIDRADGTRRLYQLDPSGIEAMRAYFDTFWNHALTAFKAAVEKEDS